MVDRVGSVPLDQIEHLGFGVIVEVSEPAAVSRIDTLLAPLTRERLSAGSEPPFDLGQRQPEVLRGFASELAAHIACRRRHQRAPPRFERALHRNIASEPARPLTARTEPPT